MSEQKRHFYQFGDFQLDISECLLLHAGESIRLTPKLFDTLLFLVENSGRVLGKDELIEKIWADTFVEEVSLAKNISALRKILAEGDSGLQYIETIPKRGYRFIAPVKKLIDEGGELPDEQDITSNIAISEEINVGEKSEELLKQNREPEKVISPASIPEASRNPRHHSIKHWVWLTILSATSLIVGTIFWFTVFRLTTNPTLSSQKIIPFTSFSGSEDNPAISPEGKQVAFTWSGQNNDNLDIYVKSVGGGEPLRLTDEPAIERNPVWSPDGSHIAFLRELPDQKVGIYVVPLLGGTARKLAETYGLPFSWSPDGEFMAVAERNSREEPFSLFLLSVKTGEKRRLTFPPNQYFGDINTVFSPDGKTLAFMRASSISAWDIYLVPVVGGEPKRLTSDNTLLDGLDWTADGREIVFSSPRSGGTASLWKIAVSGGEPERLSLVGLNAFNPSVSRQGNRLVYVHSLADSNIWRIATPNSNSQDSVNTRLISSTSYDISPVYSPDGNRIAFVSGRSGSSEIWICNSDGSMPVQLTSFGGPITSSPRWSPDGRQIVFDSSSEGNADIFVINIEDGSPRRLTSEGSEDIVPNWSKDGQWIYFTSKRSGELQIWKMSPEGGNIIQVTKQGGFEPVESPDGKYIYYAKGLNTDGIWRVPVEEGEETLIVNTLKAGYLRYWTVVDNGIYFATRATSNPTIQFFDFATNQLTEIAKLEKPLLAGNPGLSISPDGRWLLYPQIDQNNNDIILIENFR